MKPRTTIWISATSPLQSESVTVKKSKASVSRKKRRNPIRFERKRNTNWSRWRNTEMKKKPLPGTKRISVLLQTSSLPHGLAFNVQGA